MELAIQPREKEDNVNVSSLLSTPSVSTDPQKYNDEKKSLLSEEPVPRQKLVTCMICSEEFDSEMSYFQCSSGNPDHNMCLTCFADYINHCCESWATLNTIPIKCQIPKCGQVVPEHVLNKLLNDDLVAPRLLWERYCQTQLKFALSKAPQDAPELPVTCAFCGKYSEFYVKAAPDYWEKAEKERFRVKAAKEQALFEATKKLEKEMERKMQEKIRKAEEDVKDHDEIDLSIVLSSRSLLEELFSRGHIKVSELRLNIGEPNWNENDTVPLPDGFEFSEDIYRSLLQFDQNSVLDPDLWRTTKEELEKQLTALRMKINTEIGDSSDLQRKVNEKKKSREDQMKSELEQQRKTMVQHITIEIEEKLAELMGDDEKISTSQYFVCRNLFCDGAYCLRCEKFLKKPDLNSHICAADPVDNLYNQVLEALARASSRTCPTCGSTGKKDLACTHITCDQCHSRFCYVCGVAEAKLRGGFSEHNQWTLNTPDNENKCPMYLQHKYGDVRNGNQMDGDPELALERFHRELQIQEIEKLKQEVNDNHLWEEMERNKFANRPLIPPPFVPPLRKRLKPYMKRVFLACLVGYPLLYTLFYLAMYTWMIHEGRMNLHAPCSQPKLATFSIVHGVLGWLFVTIGGLLLISYIKDWDDDHELSVQCTVAIVGCTFLTMFGTFVWGAVMFYKTNSLASVSCPGLLWTSLQYYFNGIWVSTGIAVFLFLFNFWSFWFFDLRTVL